MPAKLCLSCSKRAFSTSNIVMESSPRQVAWKKKIGLKTKFPGDRIPNLKKTLRKRFPRNANYTASVDLGPEYSRRWVLFYAAEPKSPNQTYKKSAAEAYKKQFRNQGLTRADQKGVVVFKVRCPQSYKENNRVYAQHIHFMTANKNNKSWNPALFTVGAKC